LGSLLIDHSFTWRRGTVSNLGSLNTQIGSQTNFENGGTKTLSGTNWKIRGNVSGNSAVDLTLSDGAAVILENPGRWTQTSGGTLTQGTGDAGLIDVIGTFHKTGEGAFNVETGFTCSGTLDLREGAVVARGDFSLNDAGVITGGGTADLTHNMRLNVVNATSSVLRGTIRPDLDGQPARLDIQGLSTVESTFRIEVDVVTNGPFDTESVYFLTSGHPFGGTLALNVVQPPAPGEYKVIYSFVANGQFTVTGDEPFLDVIQDGNGVVCIR
jgi:hypothetical protein